MKITIVSDLLTVLSGFDKHMPLEIEVESKDKKIFVASGIELKIYHAKQNRLVLCCENAEEVLQRYRWGTRLAIINVSRDNI